MNKSGKLFVVSAPSGAGKTTLVNKVCSGLGRKYNIERVITYTSKAPRAGECDGKDYHFCSKALFEQKIKEGFFIEWSTAYGTYYGSPRSILDGLVRGKSYILVIDRAGAQAVARHHTSAVLIWITVESIMVLEQRLRSRKTEKNDEINKRLLLARKEIEDERTHSIYHYHVLNDSLENAVQKIESIILNELK